jgi:hypothetical protein
VTTISNLAPSTTSTIWSEVEPHLGECASVVEAAQCLLDVIYAKYEGTLALARIFVTVDCGDLPDFNRNFVSNLADSAGVASDLNDQTPVLSLVGTRGAKEAWNDIRQSEGHVGIPLVSAGFVDAIPMLARLLSDLGVGVSMGDDAGGVTIEASGASVDTFHVPDASTAMDTQGRNIIPMQDFVASQGVQTVFGIGGPYAEGGNKIVVAIFFTREELAKEIVQQFEPLVTQFRDATQQLISQGRIFS